MAEIGLKKVETGIDRLIEFLRGRGLTDIKEAAEKLKMPPEIIQRWTDFLVEEEIMGVEYKFTKPFIYLIDKDAEKKTKKMSRELENYKKQFQQDAKEKNVSENKAEYLWKTQLAKQLEFKKEFFYQQATIRNLVNIDSLWHEYKNKMSL